MSMSTVYLDSKYTVSDEAYAQIVAIVKANKLCIYHYRERHRYTPENPCVGREICLEHFLARHPNLTRLDKIEVNPDSTMYYFIDSQGYVYTSTEDSTTAEDVKRDTLATLTYYGYTTPDTVETRGKAVEFYAYYATLHGDLLTASVIVLSYHHASEKVKGSFLLYKNGDPVDLKQRRDLYTKASVLV